MSRARSTYFCEFGALRACEGAACDGAGVEEGACLGEGVGVAAREAQPLHAREGALLGVLHGLARGGGGRLPGGGARGLAEEPARLLDADAVAVVVLGRRQHPPRHRLGFRKGFVCLVGLVGLT